MVTVLIPWRPQPSRVEAFDAVLAWYRDNVPDAELRTIDTDDAVFNLSRCRNLGIAAVDDEGEVVVINDADTLPERAPLIAAIDAAAHSSVVQLPYTDYRWLGPAGTAELVAGTAPRHCEFELVVGACSGIYVTTPRTWWSHGGQDERFRGWGFEDAAWYVAHETLLGEPPQRHPGAVFALAHELEAREGPGFDANARLMQRYRDAAGSSEAMSQFVFSAEKARSRPAS
jgi:hypothetical protein